MTLVDEGNAENPHVDIFIGILNIIMIVCIIIGNSFILFVVLRHWRPMRAQCDNKASILFTINLSTADILVALFDVFYSLPLYSHDFSHYLGRHKILCIMSISLVITAHMASGYTLLAIALDRYLYVVHALRYVKLLNTRRTLAMIGAVWVAAILGGLPPYFWNNWADAVIECQESNIIPISYSAPIGCVFFTFVVSAIATFHWRIHREAVSIRSRTETLSTTQALKSNSARTVLIILSVFIISWTPFTVLLMLQKVGTYVSPVLFKISSSLIDVNYLVNPYIYAYSNRPVKKVILRTLRTCKQKLHHPFSDTIIDFSRQSDDIDDISDPHRNVTTTI